MNKLQQQQRELARKRADRMRSMRARGKTFEEIGQHFGISRQRVHAILTEQFPGVAS